MYFSEQNTLFEIFVEFSQSKLQTKELTTSLIWSVFDNFQSNNGWAFFPLVGMVVILLICPTRKSCLFHQGQWSRYGKTTNGKEILENLVNLNFHVLLKLKIINLETSVYI